MPHGSLSEIECAQRNALSEKIPGLALQRGAIGTLIDVFDKGERYMIEFNDERTGQCKWLGLLHRSEVEITQRTARAA